MQRKRNNQAKPMQNQASTSNMHPTDPNQPARPTRKPNANKRNITTIRDTTHALPTPRHNRTRRWTRCHTGWTNQCIHHPPNMEMEYTHQQSSHVRGHHHHHHHRTKSYSALTSQTRPVSHSPYTSRARRTPDTTTRNMGKLTGAKTWAPHKLPLQLPSSHGATRRTAA